MITLLAFSPVRESFRLKKLTTRAKISDKVRRFLFHIYRPLNAGDSSNFYIMLAIMKSKGCNATQCLVRQIIRELEDNSTQEDEQLVSHHEK